MRIAPFAIIVASLVLISGAASAGNLTFSSGKSEWHSTRCTEPVTPPSLLTMDSESPAGGMNSLMETYNAYADQMQQYMNCVGTEGQSDADTASQTIISSAQATISNAQQKVSGMHDALQAKQ